MLDIPISDATLDWSEYCPDEEDMLAAALTLSKIGLSPIDYADATGCNSSIAAVTRALMQRGVHLIYTASNAGTTASIVSSGRRTETTVILSDDSD